MAASRLSTFGWFMAGLGATASALYVSPLPIAECKSRDKFKKIDIGMVRRPKKRNQGGSECAGLMLALLACYKTYNYTRGKCTLEEKQLTECTVRVAAQPKKKDTMRYHIARIIRSAKKGG